MTSSATRGASGTSAPRSVDVARLAGVSQKTVSRVLNNEPYVSEQARQKVLAAAEALGYRLNNAARALASGRTRTIGVVSLGTALYGPATLLSGIERAARDAGYAVRVVNTFEGEASGIAGAVESLLEQGVDGIVISEPIDEGELMLTADVPVLVIGAPAPFAGRRVVTVGVGATCWPARPPSTCSTSATRRCITWPGRSAGTRRGTGWPAGAPRWPNGTGSSRRWCSATGPRPPGTPAGANWPATPR